MDKAIGGDGWAFRPADGDKPAMWAGNDSILNVVLGVATHSKPVQNIGLGCGIASAAALAFLFFGAIGLMIMQSFAGFLFFGAMGALAVIYFMGSAASQNQKIGSWLGDEWQLIGNSDRLTYSGGSSWSVMLDEIARIESGATVEWEKMREYPSGFGSYGNPQSRAIPDAEMQVFIYTHDQRRLVVHTANAAREDCGQLAYSIRSYVEAQRGNAAPSSSDTSSPAADGFDL